MMFDTGILKIINTNGFYFSCRYLRSEYSEYLRQVQLLLKQGKLFSSLNEYRYDDVKSKRNDDSFMYVKIPIGQTNFSKQNKGRLEVISQETSIKISYEELGSCHIDQIIAI
ncbi:Hypothetical_protein [Hexamita inflata]|uniref:Hypothetical_protein n=1 Tax=Hexamita inflata TaxID=28002 RepID=A0ABP1JHD8_9EUKA